MTKAPLLLAFLLADKVFREAETGKVHVAGTFNKVGAVSFPFMFNQLFIYLAMTDLREGKHELSVELRHLDGNRPILKVAHPIQSPGPLDVIEVSMGFNRVMIHEEGCLEFELRCDGAVVSGRTLRVVKMEGTIPPPAVGLA